MKPRRLPGRRPNLRSAPRAGGRQRFEQVVPSVQESGEERHPQILQRGVRCGVLHDEGEKSIEVAQRGFPASQLRGAAIPRASSS